MSAILVASIGYSVLVTLVCVAFFAYFLMNIKKDGNKSHAMFSLGCFVIFADANVGLARAIINMINKSTSYPSDIQIVCFLSIMAIGLVLMMMPTIAQFRKLLK